MLRFVYVHVQKVLMDLGSIVANRIEVEFTKFASTIETRAITFDAEKRERTRT